MNFGADQLITEYVLRVKQLPVDPIKGEASDKDD